MSSRANNVCDTCKKTFSKRSNLNRHLKNTHDVVIAVQYDMESFKCLEGCNISFKFHQELIMHLKDMHDICNEAEELKFSSIQEFYIYLNEIQTSQSVEYVRQRGAVRTEKFEVFYLYCNRSGKSRQTKSAENKRLPKVQGSKKINLSCTSQIKVIKSISDSSVVATIFKNHYGHDIALQHLKIPRTERVSIAQKLANGVTITRVLGDNQDNFNEEKLKRMDLLTRKDIHNIKNSFKLTVHEGVRHTKDAVSVDTFVQECASAENNPILFYKAQGIEDKENNLLATEDFCIIIMNGSQQHMLSKFGNNIVAIDSTHGTSCYDFELTTLLVIDEWGEGFPAACMITNKKDTSIFQIFFEQIKIRTGTLTPRVFMSDISLVFYNVWKNVMGEVPSQLYCPWHVDKAWQSNLNKIINPGKKDLVYKCLKVLQTTTDTEEFHKLLSKLLSELNDDEETRAFGCYFQSYFASNFKNWAICYRKNSGLNTNIRIDSMHKVIKYMYLDAKKVRRLDKCIFALNRFIRDKVVDRINKCIKGKDSRHLQNINSRHLTALKSSFEIEIFQNKEVSTSWLIHSPTESTCTITKLNSISKKCCQLICNLCEICIHAYSCTCTDSFIHNTICKHIHFLVLKNKYNHLDDGFSDTSSNTSQDKYSEVVDTHLETMSSEINNLSENDKLWQSISFEASKLQESAKKIKNVEVLKHALKTLRNENIFMESSETINNCNAHFEPKIKAEPGN